MSEIFSLRLPDGALSRMRAIAKRHGIGVTQLARQWIVQKIESERSADAAPPANHVREIPITYQSQKVAPASIDYAPICKRHGVRSLVLFGSGAREDFDPQRSDADFMVEFFEMPVGMIPDAYFGLHADLERALGRRVDLLEMEAIRNPYIREEIDRDGRAVYEGS